MFKTGQKAVCVEDRVGKWNFRSSLRRGPALREEVLITDVDELGYIQLRGYPRKSYYQPKYFAPIQENFAEETLKTALKQGKELHERIYV